MKSTKFKPEPDLERMLWKKFEQFLGFQSSDEDKLKGLAWQLKHIRLLREKVLECNIDARSADYKNADEIVLIDGLRELCQGTAKDRRRQEILEGLAKSWKWLSIWASQVSEFGPEAGDDEEASTLWAVAVDKYLAKNGDVTEIQFPKDKVRTWVVSTMANASTPFTGKADEITAIHRNLLSWIEVFLAAIASVVDCVDPFEFLATYGLIVAAARAIYAYGSLLMLLDDPAELRYKVGVV